MKKPSKRWIYIWGMICLACVIPLFISWVQFDPEENKTQRWGDATRLFELRKELTEQQKLPNPDPKRIEELQKQEKVFEEKLFHAMVAEDAALGEVILMILISLICGIGMWVSYRRWKQKMKKYAPNVLIDQIGKPSP